MTRIVPTFLLILIATTAQAKGLRVVIDPGHGGNDEGTVFASGEIRIAEKDVTLVLAREAARQLRARGHAVTLTRDQDREIALPDRTALANKLRADVFISIHMNSTHGGASGDAQGIETYILNNETDASSRRLARLENAVLKQDTPRAEPTDVALILKDLRLDANLDESKLLACSIQKSLISATSRKFTAAPRDRGVRQALFYVLLGADMPSVLVEAGFLTSPRDRAVVLSPGGQRSIGVAIADAIDGFKSARGTQTALTAMSRCKVH